MKMKRIILSILLVVFTAGIAFADWSVTVNWTPSPDAASEKLLMDGAEQTCPQAGTCAFSVPDLSNQAIVIRSSNTQGGYVDYAAGNLIEATLPTPASGAVIIITIVP